jgi:hypothetical protein
LPRPAHCQTAGVGVAGLTGGHPALQASSVHTRENGLARAALTRLIDDVV